MFSTRPLNPRHFPYVGEPAHGNGFPILGDFEFRTPQNWGAGGPSAIVLKLTEQYWVGVGVAMRFVILRSTALE